MISYMDRTFCPYFDRCSMGDKCASALTDEVKERASKWARTITGDSMEIPIAVCTSEPECFKDKTR